MRFLEKVCNFELQKLWQPIQDFTEWYQVKTRRTCFWCEAQANRANQCVALCGTLLIIQYCYSVVEFPNWFAPLVLGPFCCWYIYRFFTITEVYRPPKIQVHLADWYQHQRIVMLQSAVLVTALIPVAYTVSTLTGVLAVALMFMSCSWWLMTLASYFRSCVPLPPDEEQERRRVRESARDLEFVPV